MDLNDVTRQRCRMPGVGKMAITASFVDRISRRVSVTLVSHRCFWGKDLLLLIRARLDLAMFPVLF